MFTITSTKGTDNYETEAASNSLVVAQFQFKIGSQVIVRILPNSSVT